MAHIECSFKLQPFYPFNEILVAELSELGFESFTEEDPVLKAYVRKEDFNESKLKDCQFFSFSELELTHEIQEIAKENWNQKWEESFQPVEVGDFCIIRAPFHDRVKTFAHEIIIEPKMSFGTGHHATTQMMISMMQNLELNGKDLLDMGSGTGVLAILAKQLGTDRTVAIDIEDWAYENMIENFERNQVPSVEAFLGGAEQIIELDQAYDVILANINKNILLRDLPTYLNHLKSGGQLALSGFFVHDGEELELALNEQGLNLVSEKQQEDWSCLLFKKQS